MRILLTFLCLVLSQKAFGQNQLPTSDGTAIPGFVNALGYSVKVSPTILTGGNIEVTWTNPNTFTAQFDKIYLYRLEVTNYVYVESRYITGNSLESFAITDQGTYFVAYVRFLSQDIKAISVKILVTGLASSTTNERPVLEIHKTGDSTMLSWFAKTNRTYLIQFAPGLGTNWKSVGEIQGEGKKVQYLTTKPSTQSGMYRLIQW
ncbi:MAG: hypothetical protein EXS59_00205 [Candidatus Taylorbacteria bacterium]|nr:hypothetical protein [Candidatus Taylorbacteria bacterium]